MEIAYMIVCAIAGFNIGYIIGRAYNKNFKQQNEASRVSENEDKEEIFTCDCGRNHYSCDCLDDMVCQFCKSSLRKKN